jgi:hypothetical protein
MENMKKWKSIKSSLPLGINVITIQYSLRAAEEEVKVAKLNPDPLALLPVELVVAGHVLGVRSGVSGGHEAALLCLVRRLDHEPAPRPGFPRPDREVCWKKNDETRKLITCRSICTLLSFRSRKDTLIKLKPSLK